MAGHGVWSNEIVALLTEEKGGSESAAHQFVVNGEVVHQTPSQLFASLQKGVAHVVARSNFVFSALTETKAEVRHLAVLRSVATGEAVQIHDRKDELVKSGETWQIVSTHITTQFDTTNMKQRFSGHASHWKKVHDTLIGGFQGSTSEMVAKWRSLVQSAVESKDRLVLFEEHTALMEKEGAKFLSCDRLSSSDVLVVVDMQNDFLPAADAPDGGNFGVADGAAASANCVKLIAAAAAAGARIIATRDYHPKDHCSFFTQSGPFPPHCVQGHVGSHFFPPIARALVEARKTTKVDVVFKGFCNVTDTFGGFAYTTQGYTDRHLSKSPSAAQLHGCATLDWTGAFVLNCSNSENDINAPPDVMAVFERKPCASLVGSASRLVVCGLALDFCVLDTCVNFVQSKANPAARVVCAYDASRAAHIPGFGQFGSGFLSNPKFVVDKFKESNVSLAYTCQLTPSE